MKICENEGKSKAELRPNTTKTLRLLGRKQISSDFHSDSPEYQYSTCIIALTDRIDNKNCSITL